MVVTISKHAWNALVIAAAGLRFLVILHGLFFLRNLARLGWGLLRPWFGRCFLFGCLGLLRLAGFGFLSPVRVFWSVFPHERDLRDFDQRRNGVDNGNDVYMRGRCMYLCVRRQCWMCTHLGHGLLRSSWIGLIPLFHVFFAKDLVRCRLALGFINYVTDERVWLGIGTQTNLLRGSLCWQPLSQLWSLSLRNGEEGIGWGNGRLTCSCLCHDGGWDENATRLTRTRLLTRTWYGPCICNTWYGIIRANQLFYSTWQLNIRYWECVVVCAICEVFKVNSL